MSNPAINDIMDMFDIGGASPDEESNDYSNTFDADVQNKPGFDDLAKDLGDSLTGGIALEVNLQTEPEVDNTDKKSDASPNTEQVINQKEKPETLEKEKVVVSENSNEKMIKDAISLNSEDTETSIDVDDIFSQVDSSLKESDTESSIKDIAASDLTAEEPKVAEEATDANLLPENETEVDVSPTQYEPVPFDTALSPVQKDAQNEVDKSVKVKQGVKIVDGKIQWLLTPPTDKYKPFYEAKEEAIDQILPGGPIPFEQYKTELREARVNVDVRNINLDDLHDKMRDIQKWRERITYIASHVNEQFFLWDRFIEMLHGVLARTEYEKPAIRQDGLVFQHMRDMELYNQQLKAMHSITTAVAKNLDAAWDMLSRSVTIMMNEMSRGDANRYEPRPNAEKISDDKTSTEQKTVQPSQEPSPKSTSMEDMLGDFDPLEGTASVEASNKQKGSQTCDWDEL